MDHLFDTDALTRTPATAQSPIIQRRRQPGQSRRRWRQFQLKLLQPLQPIAEEPTIERVIPETPSDSPAENSSEAATPEPSQDQEQGNFCSQMAALNPHKEGGDDSTGEPETYCSAVEPMSLQESAQELGETPEPPPELRGSVIRKAAPLQASPPSSHKRRRRTVKNWSGSQQAESLTARVRPIRRLVHNWMAGKGDLIEPQRIRQDVEDIVCSARLLATDNPYCKGLQHVMLGCETLLMQLQYVPPHQVPRPTGIGNMEKSVGKGKVVKNQESENTKTTARSKGELPTLRELMVRGKLRQGYMNLTIVLGGGISHMKGSLDSQGRIVTANQRVYDTVESWCKALLGGKEVSRRDAYQNVLFWEKPILTFCDSSTEINSGKQMSQQPQTSKSEESEAEDSDAETYFSGASQSDKSSSRPDSPELHHSNQPEVPEPPSRIPEILSTIASPELGAATPVGIPQLSVDVPNTREEAVATPSDSADISQCAQAFSSSMLVVEESQPTGPATTESEPTPAQYGSCIQESQAMSAPKNSVSQEFNPPPASPESHDEPPQQHIMENTQNAWQESQHPLSYIVTQSTQDGSGLSFTQLSALKTRASLLVSQMDEKEDQRSAEVRAAFREAERSRMLTEWRDKVKSWNPIITSTTLCVMHLKKEAASLEKSQPSTSRSTPSQQLPVVRQLFRFNVPSAAVSEDYEASPSTPIMVSKESARPPTPRFVVQRSSMGGARSAEASQRSQSQEAPTHRSSQSRSSRYNSQEQLTQASPWSQSQEAPRKETPCWSSQGKMGGANPRPRLATASQGPQSQGAPRPSSSQARSSGPKPQQQPTGPRQGARWRANSNLCSGVSRTTNKPTQLQTSIHMPTSNLATHSSQPLYYNTK